MENEPRPPFSLEALALFDTEWGRIVALSVIVGGFVAWRILPKAIEAWRLDRQDRRKAENERLRLLSSIEAHRSGRSKRSDDE